MALTRTARAPSSIRTEYPTARGLARPCPNPHPAASARCTATRASAHSGSGAGSVEYASEQRSARSAGRATSRRLSELIRSRAGPVCFSAATA